MSPHRALDGRYATSVKWRAIVGNAQNLGKNRRLATERVALPDGERVDQVTGEHATWTRMRAALAADPGLQAFRWIPGVSIFIKDRDRRFVYFNRQFEDMMGRNAQELLGKRDEDLSPEYLVDHYRSDDNAVLASGIELAEITELVNAGAGVYDWNITSKWPLLDREGDICGVGGVTRRVRERTNRTSQYTMLTPAIEIMVRDISKTVPLGELAKTVALSPSQFSRAFKARFGVTPQRYQRTIRLDAACEMLSTTEAPISVIATRCGYYDQSHMTNEFRQRKNMPPAVYRERFRVADSEEGARRDVGKGL